MSLRDISFYKYLEAAFRYRLFNPQGASATPDTCFNYLGYNLPFKRIFYYARRILPKFYTNAFPDTEEGNLQMARSVLQKLDKHQDSQLKEYFDPATAPEENVPVIAEASQESAAQQAPPAAAATAGSLPGMAMPPLSVSAVPRRIIHNIPPAATAQEAETPKIAVANKSGVVAEALKTFGSNAQIFAKRNLGKVFDGLKGIGSGVGSGIAGSIRGGLGAAAPALGRAFHGGLNGIERITRPGGLSPGGTKSLMSSGSKKLAWGLLGAFLLMIGAGLLGGLTETTSPGQAKPLLPPAGGGDISRCEFTRADNPQLIKSTILQGWITSAAAATEISAQVLASVAMHENQDFVANADNNHDAIKSNQFCNRGLKFCEDGHGHVLHNKADIGKDDPCTPQEIANGNRTAQAVGLMQLLDIYNPGKDLCSITENLAIAAAKLKADGITAQPTQEQVNKAVYQYYNSCTYGSYSYCDEVWQDVQNCQAQSGGFLGGSDFASQLVDKIKTSLFCNGSVTISNLGTCLFSIRPVPDLTTKALTDSVSMPGSMGVLQCVGFVKAVATDLIDQLGNAIDYALNPVPGYSLIPREGNQIQIGDLPIWSATANRPYGHIAYVVNANDDGSFQVAEANFCKPDCGTVDLRIDSINDDQIVGWLRKK